MFLKVIDRLMITNLVLPREANFVEAILSRGIHGKVDFTTADLMRYGITAVGEQIKWNPAGDEGQEIAFDAAEVAFLKKQVDRLDREGKITNQALDICKAIKEAP
jgi:hypothetical protein